MALDGFGEPPLSAIWGVEGEPDLPDRCPSPRCSRSISSAPASAASRRSSGAWGDEVDKFERCAWHAGPAGVPLLDDYPRLVVGRRTALLDAGGDHVCVILEPVAASPGSGALLTFQDVTDLVAGHPPEDRQQPR